MLFLLVWGGEASAQSKGITGKEGRILVRVDDEKTLTTESLMGAVAYRLPEYSVVSADAPTEANCPPLPHYFRLSAESDKEVTVIRLVRCRDRELMWSEAFNVKDDETLHRKVSVMVALTLEERDDAGMQNSTIQETDSKKPTASKSSRHWWLMLSAMPGLVADFGEGVVFAGDFGVGTMAFEKLLLEFGSRICVSRTGVATKQNDKVRTKITTQEFDFRLSAAYRHIFTPKFWGSGGLGFGYAYFRAKVASDEKFNVEKPPVSVRFSALPHLQFGYRPFSRLSLFSKFGLDLPFGKRRFKVRGENAMILGLSIYGGVGAILWL